MQWDDSPNAGFSRPDVDDLWLPIAANYKEVNVASELKDPRSFLNFYRKLLATRKATPALLWGDYASHDLQSSEAQQNCFVFERRTEDQQILVALNFSGQDQALSLPGLVRGRIILSTRMDREDEVDLASFTLRANEGCIIAL